MTTHGGSHFDRTPIKIGGFELRSRSAVPVTGVSITPAGWHAAVGFCSAAEHASPFWVADLLNYAESREDWAEKLDQLKSDTGYAHQTLLNIASVGRRVQGKARDLTPSFRHADVVAKLEPKEQIAILTLARDEELTVQQTRQAVQRLLRPTIVEGQAELTGQYRVIYADPPWLYRNATAMPDGSQTPAADSYPPMTTAEIVALPVERHSMDDAVLFLWSTASHLMENPGPRDVIEAWGFTYKTFYVWDKVLGRPGHYSYVQHEALLIATRGKATPDVSILQHDHASIQRFRREGEHSRKPPEFRTLIEKLYTQGPYLELFGRTKAKGWAVYGNDARLWSKRKAS